MPNPLPTTTGSLYRTIVADPPWPYKSPGGPGSSLKHRPNQHRAPRGPSSVKRYGAMSLTDLAALAPPVADNAHLYLWTTNGFVCEAHELARAWGFRPITLLTWVKVKPDGDVSMKTGYYFRGASEHVVFAVRGSLKLQTQRGLPTAFQWPRTAHSVKPEPFYDMVEEASPGPRLELFARRRRLGWDAWGNEIDSDVELAA